MKTLNPAFAKVANRSHNTFCYPYQSHIKEIINIIGVVAL